MIVLAGAVVAVGKTHAAVAVDGAVEVVGGCMVVGVAVAAVAVGKCKIGLVDVVDIGIAGPVAE